MTDNHSPKASSQPAEQPQDTERENVIDTTHDKLAALQAMIEGAKKN